MEAGVIRMLCKYKKSLVCLILKSLVLFQSTNVFPVELEVTDPTVAEVVQSEVQAVIAPALKPYVRVTKEQVVELLNTNKLFPHLYFLVQSSQVKGLKKDLIIEVLAQILLHDSQYESAQELEDAQFFAQLNKSISDVVALGAISLKEVVPGRQKYEIVAKDFFIMLAQAIKKHSLKNTQNHCRANALVKEFCKQADKIYAKSYLSFMPSLSGLPKNLLYLSLASLALLVAKEVHRPRKEIREALESMAKNIGVNAVTEFKNLTPGQKSDILDIVAIAGVKTLEEFKNLTPEQERTFQRLIAAFGVVGRQNAQEVAAQSARDAAAAVRNAGGWRGSVGRFFVGSGASAARPTASGSGDVPQLLAQPSGLSSSGQDQAGASSAGAHQATMRPGTSVQGEVSRGSTLSADGSATASSQAGRPAANVKNSGFRGLLSMFNPKILGAIMVHYAQNHPSWFGYRRALTPPPAVTTS